MRITSIILRTTLALSTVASSAAQSIGTTYCTTAPNTTGAVTAISASGSTVVSANDVTLVGADMPPNTFGMFVVSRDQGFVMNPGGSQGNLCLGGAIGRFTQSIVNSGAAGQVSVSIDLTNIPHPLTHFAVMPGDTLNFQLWHRDTVPMVGATSNYSEGLEISFTGGPPNVSWSQDVYPLLETVNSVGVSCVGCHGGTCNLDLATPATAYANLVGVTSSCCAPAVFVTPGDANASLLYTKIVAPTCGGPMPAVGSFPGDPGIIRDWINAGALNN